MKFAQCLLVALALWMPAASFAAAVEAAGRVERTAPCEEPASDESSESRAENELILPVFDVPLVSVSAYPVHHDGHSPLNGHIAELLLPPPNPASLR